MTPDIPILIVGSQLSGLSTGYHIINEKVPPEHIAFFDASIESKGSTNWLAGTPGPGLPKHTKFVCIPDDSSYSSLSHTRIGKMGARLYLSLKRNGVWLQREIAERFNKELVRNLGTVVLSSDRDESKLLEEYNLYSDLGFGSTLNEFENGKICDIFSTSKHSFTKGLFVPDDFIIDIDGYINALAISLKGSNFLPGHIVNYLEDKEDHVIVHYSVKHIKNGKIEITNETPITAGKVVFATNGFYEDSNLKGLLKQYWNFVLCFKDEGENTPNAFYFGKNGHYFTRQEGILIVGGEDTPVIGKDFLTPSKQSESLEKLLSWTHDTFPKLAGKNYLYPHYGVFCETADNLPIVGKFNQESNIYYIVGCNGDGQSALSYASYLLPAIMGFRSPRSKDEIDYIELISPTRQTLKKR